jgi:hypothetical protein
MPCLRERRRSAQLPPRCDAERWSGQPRMVCGKGARVLLGIGSRFRPPVNTVPPRQSLAGRKSTFLGHCRLMSDPPMPTLMSPIETMSSRRGKNRPFGPLRAHERPADADLDVSYDKHEVANRMDVPVGIGSLWEPRGAAPLSQARHASRAIETRPHVMRSAVSDLWRRRDRRIAIDPAVMHA